MIHSSTTQGQKSRLTRNCHSIFMKIKNTQVKRTAPSIAERSIQNTDSLWFIYIQNKTVTVKAFRFISPDNLYFKNCFYNENQENSRRAAKDLWNDNPMAVCPMLQSRALNLYHKPAWMYCAAAILHPCSKEYAPYRHSENTVARDCIEIKQ